MSGETDALTTTLPAVHKFQARNGKTSEIITTDAEGRLVLADALVEADSEDPDLIIDCATLTGGCRVVKWAPGGRRGCWLVD